MSPPDVSRKQAGLLAATLLAAVYSFVVLVLPTRGLTFVVDDWEHLFRITRTPWPDRWLLIAMEHWMPAFWALLELKVRLLGPNPFAFVVVSWANHVLNVYLLGRLVLARTGDGRAAALATVLFGVTTQSRTLIWWAFSMGGWTACLTVILLGLLAFERYRETGRGLSWAALATFAAPLFMGSGLALGPVLLLDAWTLPRERRVRALGAIGVGLAAYVAVFLPVLLWGHGPKLWPRDPGELALAAGFAVKVAGMASAGGVLLAPVEVSAERGPLYLGLYLGVLAAALAGATREERPRLLAIQGFVAIVATLIGLVRWSFPPEQASESRYLYVPSIAWVVTAGFIFRLALRRSPRTALVGSLVILAALAALHADAAGRDRGRYSPAVRRDHPRFIQHFRAAVDAATGPVYDARFPHSMALHSTSASAIYALIAPTGTATFTTWRTAETLAPYARDPVLAPLADSP